MIPDGTLGLYLGVMVLGAVHGILPDHGWPVAAMYAMNQKRTWLHGLASGFILGFGHLVSSITVVLVYFWALSYFDLTEIHGLHYLAGAVLIILGVREYVRGGHSHDHVHADEDGHDHDDHDHDDHAHAQDGEHDHAHDDHAHDDGQVHDHDHDDHDHDDHAHAHDGGHDHGPESPGWLRKIKMAIPFVGSDEAHEHTHSLEERADERGLYGIAAFAFLLGFAHNEEIEIIAICTGSDQCLELMFAYALTVLIAVVAMTLLLIAGFERYKDRIEQYQGYLPTITAAVLVIMGLAFIAGVF
ncbi:hypothetical protein [Halovivax gelatinilyticus]|uniref:hypothetical protein n=1 Tax=Halovivax gelatinilyticus TaxID=2961597 RepID=UPI0020CA38BE|nr:hypothetical protein [Halovivax gelatinilyticus]